MGFFQKQLERYHEAMNRLFSSYGAFVAHRPFIPLVIGIIVLGALCIGLLNAKKETDLEILWVEQNSRVVPEKHFFDAHFGGLPRKEAVTINAKASLDDALPDYGLAMDALTEAIKPLYNLTYNVQLQGKTVELNQGDFCERPPVPQSLRKGAAQGNNYLAWGYRNVSNCVLNNIHLFVDSTFNQSLYGLPSDWGFETFPCYKLSPMDCFKEGRDFDYPEELQQLEQLVPFSGSIYPLNQLVYGVENQFNYLCLRQLQTSLNNSGAYTTQEVTQITSELKVAISALAVWGYNWRKSYKEMESQEILDYFNEAIETAKHASTNILDPAIAHCIMENKSCCVSWFGTHIPLTASFGSVDYNASGSISKIGAIRWGANNWNQNHPLFIEYLAERINQSLDDSARKDLVVGFESLMINKLSPLRENAVGTNFTTNKTFGDLQVQFTVWRSPEDVLIDANRTPIWQLILSAVLVSVYAFFAFVNVRQPVHSHTALVLTGLTVVSFAVIAGFGFTSAVGIKLTPLAGSVVPFLALGLGIDDVFVLVTILRNFLEDKKVQALGVSNSPIPEHEMRLTIALAGPSVVLTTFSVLASFFISSLNRMPIVRWFCWQMGITATIHTLGMLLIFTPIMALDAKRVKSQINDPNLWLIFGREGKKETSTQGKSIDKPGPSIQESAASSPISIAVAKFYAPLFNSNLFKIFVVIIFAGLLGSMTYLGFWKVENGLKLSEITLKGSYQHDFSVVTEDRFPSYDIWLVTQDSIDYPNSQQQLIELYTAAQQNLSTWLPVQPKIWEVCWLGNVYLSMNQSQNLSYPLPATEFYSLVELWTASAFGAFSLQDLNCYNTSTGQHTSCLAQQDLPQWGLQATKTALFAEHLGADTGPNLDLIRDSRKFADDFNNKYFNGSKAVYAYGYPFLFFEQYLHSSRDLYMVVGLALVGVFLAVLVFQFSITTSLIIAMVLLMVDIEVYGFLYIIGAKLNALSLVNLGIVIGMASEFTYLARSFLVVNGTRNHRVGKALEWTFEPLLHGFGTQVAATLPLLFLKYHAFRVYYFAMFTIMGVLGFLNGFVLLPVLLSWLGPPPLPHVMASAAGREVLMTENAHDPKPPQVVDDQSASMLQNSHSNDVVSPSP